MYSFVRKKELGGSFLKIKRKKLETINLLGDAMFKALFRSIEARKMVAAF